jgi:hypothetical protein
LVYSEDIENELNESKITNALNAGQKIPIMLIIAKNVGKNYVID